MERRYRGGIFFPVALIAAGVILLLNNLHITDLSFMEVVARAWPALVISMGLDLALRRNGFITPFLLTVVGVAALLNTLGVWQWDMYGFATRLWPLLIIAIGVDIVLSKPRSVGSLVGVIPALFGIAMLGLFLGSVDVAAGPSQTRRISRPIGEASSALVSIEAGTANIHLAALPQAGPLIEGSVTVRQGAELDESVTVSGGVATYRLRGGGATMGWWGVSTDEDWLWDLRLAPEVPIDLDLRFAAGAVDADLSGTAVRSLRINGAFGAITLTLPAGRSLDAKIENVFGSCELVVPAGVAVRVRAENLIGGVDLAPGFTQQSSGVYVSDNYEGASDRIEVRVDQVLGGLEIRRPLG